MEVTSLVWVGTRTPAFAETKDFFTDVIGLRAVVDQPDFAVLDAPDGSTVEIFGPRSEYNRHLTFRAPDGFVYELVQDSG